ncbi:MarR family transcriptional regulator [Actinokineospora sp. NBRC 105648]|uniref:MarR family winged helix-turn-helix transcriptional regulator n=1 Tax=Actinokineospora sp. NBRC 105648 TaxID=3032206 RepID=UPI0024A274BB|nr:MarR family transcriptional regulator [Actinokineospora sp. NBRC 105648]GLZ37051.1 MarR family transcriptional regulator [Actinokineospora sp. NBRC 105648]
MFQRPELIDQWRSLTLRYNEIACRLDRELAEAHGVSMNEFETLDRLAAQDCDSLRMQDLAAAMYLSQSALSRTVARLEKAGLVDRSLCEADRRGVFVRITDEGRARHAGASRTHLTILTAYLTAAK